MTISERVFSRASEAPEPDAKTMIGQAGFAVILARLFEDHHDFITH
jgi:hypothetical protein